MTTTEDRALAAAAREGDEPAFSELTQRYRRELHVHCYRMLGSFHDSEDVVQETFLKAWRGRESFQGRSTLRAWLYGIATHGCLDFLAARKERVVTSDGSPPELPPHVPWLEPFPDRLLGPESTLLSRENIELAFLVAVQFLPPKQRAVLILSDVLEWSAKETAELLDLTVAAVNSALQRARATLREHQPSGRSAPAPSIEPDERLLVERYVEATERSDVKAIVDLLRDDLRFSMPPQPEVFAGRDSVMKGWEEGGFGTPEFGELRCVITRANRMPAVACYLRKPGEAEFLPLAMDVLRFEGGRVAEITTFSLEAVIAEFDLPPKL